MKTARSHSTWPAPAPGPKPWLQEHHLESSMVLFYSPKAILSTKAVNSALNQENLLKIGPGTYWGLLSKTTLFDKKRLSHCWLNQMKRFWLVSVSDLFQILSLL